MNGRVGRHSVVVSGRDHGRCAVLIRDRDAVLSGGLVVGNGGHDRRGQLSVRVVAGHVMRAVGVCAVEIVVLTVRWHVCGRAEHWCANGA